MRERTRLSRPAACCSRASPMRTAESRFALGKAVDRIVALARGGGHLRLWCRPLRDWLALLERLGFRARAVPMSARTPFANFLLIAEP